MGIIDDYYGGYENIAMFTNEDGETDFEAAYYHANDLDLDDDPDFYDYAPRFSRPARGPRRGAVVPGWAFTGRFTMAGKPIYEGSCSGCGQHTTVPFKPHPQGSAPLCRQCHKGGAGGPTQQQQQQQQQQQHQEVPDVGEAGGVVHEGAPAAAQHQAAGGLAAGPPTLTGAAATDQPLASASQTQTTGIASA